MQLRHLFILTVAFTLGGCDDPTEPSSRYLGYISGDQVVPDVEVTQVDSTLAIVVYTFGLSTCYVRSGEDVVVDDLTVTVRPFDRITGAGDAGCGDAIVIIEHPVTIDITEEGTWVVRVEGTAYNEGETVPASVETEIEVDLPDAEA